MRNRTYIPVRNSQIRYYVRVPLYFETAHKVFHLYKPAGMEISEIRLDQGMHPRLFIQQADRMEAIREVHKGFNADIAHSMESGDVSSVKSTLCTLVAEAFSEPRAGSLQSLPETLNILVSGYSKQPGLLRTFATISNKDYTTVIHSVNVMALSLGFCFSAGLSLKETRRIGLSALLHDVGKAEIPPEILSAPRKLTSVEFEVMKSHPAIGARIICDINRLDDDIAAGALEHHEKLDGSGYPKGLKKISFPGQLIGIVDCYEALTNEERPYRRAQNPLGTLRRLKAEVEAGKFSRRIFEKFCCSLI